MTTECECGFNEHNSHICESSDFPKIKYTQL